MIGQLLSVQCYNYSKDGKQKQGRILTLMACDEVRESDGNGNAVYGYPTEEVFVPTAFGMSDIELAQLVGEVIDIRKEKRIGERWEKIVSITKVDSTNA